MGTKNLTMVIYGGKTRVAQYGQWDGYPSGQGAIILAFITKYENDVIKNKFDKVNFIDAPYQRKLDRFYKKIGIGKDGYANQVQYEEINKKFPLITRDNGGNILQMIMDSTDKNIRVSNQEDFAANGLMNEWTYVLDLDKNVLEVYTGFNHKPLVEGDRFYPMQVANLHINEYNSGSKYYPVKLLKSYSLNEIPTEGLFISELNRLNGKDDEEVDGENAPGIVI